MRSVVRTVDSRGAMISTVRPLAIRFMFCWMIRSLDTLALVVERACRLVEDQDARIGDQRASDGDPLPLATDSVGDARRQRA